MPGCFGSSKEDRAMQAELNAHLKNQFKDDAREHRIEARARDKFMALPDFYTPARERNRFTNMDDAIGSLKQEELICVARAIRDGDNKLAGEILAASLMRVFVSEAEDEITDKEWSE